ncbi:MULTISPECIES: hypothetical protein [Vibrio]|uniref:Uncharacterized protein n=1 Tax=Vibrio gigantis TaxID=296199 RepID=A0A5M9NPE9_9VIBR|nr:MULTISPECIES: hypothetical protein [Vibrio]KAA8672329.1 hypothetical protein F4W18_15325 [Vibrio gigantis]TCT50283.1 hypothetical protein EDB42_108107 [Vibrio crassostreae]TCT75269.1 hypothetical protein EDB41_10851 [Vibrio crassostreae]TCT94306.1 hypothetical protein EDB38_109107 [Vibrio crassostreae]
MSEFDLTEEQRLVIAKELQGVAEQAVASMHLTKDGSVVVQVGANITVLQPGQAGVAKAASALFQAIEQSSEC